MCSVGDEYIVEEPTSSVKLPKGASDKCHKCRTEKPQVVLRHKDRYCKNCFLAGTVHKFKALLGKSRMILPGEKVLVHYKGGHAVTALLHFLRTGADLKTPKKLQFVPVILFVENEYNLSVETRTKIANAAYEEVQSFNFPIYFVSLIKYISNSESVDVATNINELGITDTDEDKIKNSIDEKAGLNYAQDILRIIERNLLIDVAKNLDCKHVFTTELSVDLASQMLTNVSLGRGAQLQLDTGFCDSRDPKIRILRPLRDFDQKELALYNFFNNLQPISYLKNQENPYKSVQGLMRKFVNQLQVNYPATITTVMRTGDKIISGKTEAECSFCKASIENRSDLSSAEATSFSHWISTQVSDVSSENSTFDVSKDPNYCFSCSKIVNFIKK